MSETEQNSKKITFSKINSRFTNALGELIALDKTQLERFSVSKQNILRAIDNKDVETLRQISQYFFHASGEYRRLVAYLGNILTFDYLVIPKVSPEHIGDAKFEKAHEDITNYFDNAYVKETGRHIAQSVVRDGAFYGYEREIDGRYICQQLPTNFCRSRFKIDGIYAVEFNFSFFDQFRTKEEKEEAFNSFPSEFEPLYSEYLKDTQNNRWLMLDSDYARAHMIEDEVPLFSPVFTALIDLEDSKNIDKTRSLLDIYKLIVQKLPTDENGELTMEMEEIEAIHQNTRDMVQNSAVDVITTPADLKEIKLTDRQGIAQDDTEKAMQVIYGSAGTPMILFSSGLKTGSIGLERAIVIDESLMFTLLGQFKIWYDLKISKLVKNKNFTFFTMFPEITIFNWKDKWKTYSEASSQGYPTKLLGLAALGISQSESNSLLLYENEFLNLPERMIPTSSSHTQASNEGGRPESEGPLSEEGDATKDQDKNKNRA